MTDTRRPVFDLGIEAVAVDYGRDRDLLIFRCGCDLTIRPATGALYTEDACQAHRTQVGW